MGFEELILAKANRNRRHIGRTSQAGTYTVVAVAVIKRMLILLIYIKEFTKAGKIET